MVGFVKGKDGCLLIKRDKTGSSNRKRRRVIEKKNLAASDKSKSESIVGSCSILVSAIKGKSA